MHKTFIYESGKIKVTYNERPMLIDYEEEHIIKKVEHKTKAVSKSFLIGLEVMFHTGGRICYGMFTAGVCPNNEPNSVKISIAVTPQNTIRYRDSILFNDEYAYKGLPKEYVELTENSISQSIKGKEIYPQCDITFKYAANCEVGSSPMMFGYIAEIIMDMIYAVSMEESSMEEILNMNIEDFTNQYVKKSGYSFGKNLRVKS